jgi:hypothetical protein
LLGSNLSAKLDTALEPTTEVETAIDPLLPAEPPTLPDPDSMEIGTWYLGLNLGLSSITAVLFQVEQQQWVPLTWAKIDENTVTPIASQLPAVGYFVSDQLADDSVTPIALAYDALDSATFAAELALTGVNAFPSGVLLHPIKPYLNMVVPYPTGSGKHCPMIQWSDQQTLSLHQVRQTLVQLFSTLRGTATVAPSLDVTADGFSPRDLHQIMEHLAGVVIGIPVGWSEAYRFNLREAVLASWLVQQPSQVMMVDEAIAIVLGQLYQSSYPGSSFANASFATQGGTLVLNAHANQTDLTLVDLPSDFHALSQEDFFQRSLAYGLVAFHQDVLCQLLYPHAKGWEILQLGELDLPLPGEPDQVARYRLQQRLESSILGKQVLEAVRQTSLTLYQEDSATLTVDQTTWTVNQRDLHHRVLLPYLQQLNRELNLLLTQAGMTAEMVTQVMTIAELVEIPAIAHWLRQKLPNATIAIAPPLALAQGLAVLPCYPNVYDHIQHQYSDYFLLKELLRIFPNEPLTLVQTLQLLEQQGINTSACRYTLLNVLEGQLPAGLIPNSTQAVLLDERSLSHPFYQALAMSPLFSRRADQTYQMNTSVQKSLLDYFAAIVTDTHQTLAEPLTLELGIPSQS